MAGGAVAAGAVAGGAGAPIEKALALRVRWANVVEKLDGNAAVGGALIASNTAPVTEVLRHDENARLFDFFDKDALVGELNAVLDDASLRERLGATARTDAVEGFDLRNVCLPKQLAWVKALAG